MLSLSPRFDLFRICLPSEFIPTEIYEKWLNLLNKNQKNVMRTPIDFLNESIQGLTLTGINGSSIMQPSPYHNNLINKNEPVADVSYKISANPLSLMENKLTITFRHTQGFYNYYLLLETWFWQHSNTYKQDIPFFIIETMSETGEVLSHITLQFPVFDSIDDLNLSYSKVERSTETFNCSFTYSDIDFELGPAPSSDNINYVL